MSDVHAGPELPDTYNRCRWHTNFEDVYVTCHDTAIPGVGLCAEHFIHVAHERALRGIPAAA